MRDEIYKLVCLDSNDPEGFPILMEPRIVRKNHNGPEGLNVILSHTNGGVSLYNIHPNGKVLGLNPPEINRNTGKISPRTMKFPFNEVPYVADTIRFGKENIVKYLKRKGGGFEYYAILLNIGKLRIGKSVLRRIVEDVGLGFLLPNPQFRF